MLHRSTDKTKAARPEDVTVRLADYSDARALVRLAALDSGAVPDGPTVLAEVDGTVVAALPLSGGRAIADPFHRTAALTAMLELRAAQLRGDHPGRTASLGERFRGLARAARLAH